MTPEPTSTHTPPPGGIWTHLALDHSRIARTLRQVYRWLDRYVREQLHRLLGRIVLEVIQWGLCGFQWLGWYALLKPGGSQVFMHYPWITWSMVPDHRVGTKIGVLLALRLARWILGMIRHGTWGGL